MGNEEQEDCAIIFDLNDISSISYNNSYTYVTLKTGVSFGVSGDSYRKLQLAMNKKGIKND